jgi:valyl-tRNA synthetase
MDKTYLPAEIEARIYARWRKEQQFDTAKTGTHPAAEPFCIMLPPPNVTGDLHMGHAFQQTLMDILVRIHRMQGDPTLWQIGMDHAGIATQLVVENQLHREGKTRYDLGREAFVKRVWDWKNQSGGNILKQMQRLGVSADESRERFTMDEGLSAAVQTAFIKLHEAGLIYRGKRLVNWDPKLKTAVSDLEVIHTQEAGFMYHIRYPLIEHDASIVVATTRPETLLADTAVAVHPDDPRYAHLIGQQLALPLTERTLPIIADESIDREFGTGCVKITPAHDFNDYAMGERHGLPMITLFTLDGHLNAEAPEAYRGLERFAARKKIVADLEHKGFLVDKKPHTLSVPRNERGNTILEPMLTPQWYVKMQSLAAPALHVVETGEIQFVPKDWQNTYFRWLENIQDWCISRQLWWGHRIPAWYDEQGQVFVGENEAQVREKYSLDNTIILTQDEDVLDTWFSSALWPFSTLGWPEKTPDFELFFPTSVLITGFDIIFFWVARMIMFSLFFTGKVPFHTVYIHGLVRDSEGQKMSKSKGNGLDPVDLIDGIDLPSLISKRTASLMQESLAPKVLKMTEKQFPQGIAAYGTDALRFTFAAMASPSRDLNFDVKRLEGYRNFCNKLWNAARFVLMNLDKTPRNDSMMDQGETTQSFSGELSGAENIHAYFDFRLNRCIGQIHEALNTYRFDLMAQHLYDFFWNEYCDWYLELCKVILNNPMIPRDEKAHTHYALLAMLEKILRLAHPIIPFVTEEIWQTLKAPLNLSGETIMHSAYPQPIKMADNLTPPPFTEALQSLITQIRTLRSERNIHPNKSLPLYFEGSFNDASMMKPYLTALAKVTRIEPLQSTTDLSTAQRFGDFYLGDVIDLEAEKIRISKEKLRLETEITRLKTKLSDVNFTQKAPALVVEKERQLLQNLEVEYAKLEA